MSPVVFGLNLVCLWSDAGCFICAGFSVTPFQELQLILIVGTYHVSSRPLVAIVL